MRDAQCACRLSWPQGVKGPTLSGSFVARSDWGGCGLVNSREPRFDDRLGGLRVVGPRCSVSWLTQCSRNGVRRNGSKLTTCRWDRRSDAALNPPRRLTAPRTTIDVCRSCARGNPDARATERNVKTTDLGHIRFFDLAGATCASVNTCRTRETHTTDRERERVRGGLGEVLRAGPAATHRRRPRSLLARLTATRGTAALAHLPTNAGSLPAFRDIGG